ncbi:MAG TPA: NFACT family protein [Rectinemataceae bacterium]|nr:NFACT family protein [Rectinemataceae bacterium]
MSLNWKEIELVLSELDLAGAKIERIIQPSYDSVCLGLYKAGTTMELLVSIAQGACRIHLLSSPPPKPERPLRFMECLRSRIRGGRIDAIRQLGSERIVRMDITVPRTAEEPGAPVDLLRYRLYARLWSGAGNLVLVDEDGIVVDALARRPRRGETSGQVCAIEESALPGQEGGGQAGSGKRVFEVRDLGGEGSFNRRVEDYYSARGGELSRDRLLATARERYAKKGRALDTRIAELEKRSEEFRGAERWRELGDILMANQAMAPASKYLECDDFYLGGTVTIPVDPRLSVVANAQGYYERHRKARSGLTDLESELEAARESRRALDTELAALEAEENPFLIARALAKGGAARENRARSYPGLSLERGGWTILVGRSAKENDELLRRHVRGSDMWLHARDWPGSYVFIKAQRSKTVPLEILLDAGNLAIYYSKGRSNGGGDVYYTLAKYLRRAKDGPKGLVIPTQEKNLAIRLDEGRLKELRALIGRDED